MNRIALAFLALFILAGLVPPPAHCAGQAQGRYVTLHYTSKEDLKSFNERLDLGRKLSRQVGKKNIVTIEDEVLAKLDTVMEKVEVVLDMFPADLRINVVLLTDAGDVSQVFAQKYGKRANHIAYYSLSEDTIYISVKDTRLAVIAHEMGHAVVDHYFTERPPYNIHELMAQFAEKHISD
jgi:hypothetical protein